MVQEQKAENQSILHTVLLFALPYLLSCFLQNFYGMADLFIVGQFNDAATITAVSTGSQVIHMLTVIITGLAMGTTVTIGQSVGAGDKKKKARAMGNSVTIFLVFAVFATVILLAASRYIILAVQTPVESQASAMDYLLVCFAGVPFITAYNVLSSMFRGLGDSRRPMIFVAIAGVFNIILDYILVGPFAMGARGAAIATVIAQALSVLLAVLALRRFDLGIRISFKDLIPERNIVLEIIQVGIPIACQDGFIQIAFLVITAIANSRGVEMAASVGIVEKIITFLFLVNSAMLSTVSAIAAQKIGAGRRDQAKQVLYLGLKIAGAFALMAIIVCEIFAPQILSLFVTDEAAVVVLGSGYLRAYIFDCFFAGIHFCFSGYFCACEKSMLSFIQNVIGITLIRIPGAWLMSLIFPATLVPLGLVTASGSLLQALICIVMFVRLEKNNRTGGER